MIAAEDQERARRSVEEVEKLFTKDAEASLVIGAWKDEMTGPEIRECLEWSEQKYETVVTRIRRTARSKVNCLGNGHAQ